MPFDPPALARLPWRLDGWIIGWHCFSLHIHPLLCFLLNMKTFILWITSDDIEDAMIARWFMVWLAIDAVFFFILMMVKGEFQQ